MKYEVRKNDDEVLISSCQSDVRRDYSYSFEYEGIKYFIYLEVENIDERKSTSKRRTFFDILEKIAKSFIVGQQNKFNKYNHIIQTISTQISQKMDGYLGNEKWYSSDYSEALKNIENISSNKKNETNRLIHYFNKMSLDLKNHIEGWGIIYIKNNYIPNYDEVSLKKAILNQFSSFSEDFSDMGIKVSFSDYFLDDYTVFLDKKLFSLIMYNFFSNALKYSMPEGVIKFNYSNESKSLDISMYSVKIERSEISKIFDDGIRGLNANSVSSSGNGSGLYVIKKSLELMDMPNMYINSQYTRDRFFGDVQYFENHFKFDLRKKEIL